jgi:hypothetical protein
VSHNIVVMTRLPQVEVSNAGKSVPESGRRLEWHSLSPRSWWWTFELGCRLESTQQTPESCGWWCCRTDVGSAMMCCRVKSAQHRWGDLAVAQYRYRVLLTMALPSQRWLWRDVTIGSCWQWHCRGNVAHGTTKRPWCDIAAKSC